MLTANQPPETTDDRLTPEQWTVNENAKPLQATHPTGNNWI